MDFMMEVVLMWLLMAVVTRKPMKFWLPVSCIVVLLTLTTLNTADLSEKENWGDGLFVGSITGAGALQILAWRSKKREAGLMIDPANPDDPSRPDGDKPVLRS